MQHCSQITLLFSAAHDTSATRSVAKRKSSAPASMARTGKNRAHHVRHRGKKKSCDSACQPVQEKKKAAKRRKTCARLSTSDGLSGHVKRNSGGFLQVGHAFVPDRAPCVLPQPLHQRYKEVVGAVISSSTEEGNKPAKKKKPAALSLVAVVVNVTQSKARRRTRHVSETVKGGCRA